MSGAKSIHRQDYPAGTDHEVHDRIVFEDFPPLLLALSQCLLGAFLLGNVVAGNHDRCRSPVPVSLQRPAGGHDDRCSIAFLADELSLIAADAQQLGFDLVERQRKSGLHEFVGDLPRRFGAFPAIQFLGAAIPIGDNIVVEAAGDDGIVRHIEETGLFAQRRFGRFALQRKKSCGPDRRDADGRIDCGLG